ncbi:UNVERIFIED_CONTAM: hypothetical protein HDU68_012060 [Siphonaria sp. JEL0065]|nr:hypothetical protein HDU68_012060 [Siphonaria sp. JEL0065]
MATIDATTLGLGFAALVLLMKYRSDSFRSGVVDTHPMILRNQTHFSQTRNKGEWAIARNRATPFPTKNHPQFVNSLFESLVKLLASTPDRPFLHYKPIPNGPFASVSVSHVSTLTKNTGAGLIHLAGGETSHLGIFIEDAKDVVDLLVLDFVSILYGFIGCWWSDENTELGDNVLGKVLALSELRVVVVSESGIDKVLNVAGQSKKLQHIVVAGLNAISKTHVERAAALKVNISTLDSVREIGKEHPKEFNKPEQTDTACILFESSRDSTKGEISGTVLTHSNVAVAISAVYVTLPQAEKINEQDVLLLRSHCITSFECCLVYATLFAGGQVGFSSSDSLILDEIALLRPTLLTSSAQVLQKLSGAITSHPQSKGFAFQYAISAKKRELAEGRSWTGTIYDKFVLKPVERGVFGGKLRVVWNLHSAKQPTDVKSVELIRAVLGTQVFETFSRSEACGLVACSGYGDYEVVAHVGIPAANLEYKLIDAPGIDYLVTDSPNPRGSVCIRGPATSKTYFKDPIKSAAVVDGEGWIRLGGVYGEVRANGTLKLI